MSRPLLPRLDRELLQAECARRDTNLTALAEAAGVTGVYSGDGLTWSQADRLACALGFHPSYLWGDDWWAVDAAYEKARADAEARRKERQRRRDELRRRKSWNELERSWRAWLLERERLELHREEWAA